VSSNSSASGANLQVATNVIFVDIPGESPKQAATIVHQAIGRVIRLGQESKVNITYFVGEETIEESLQSSLADSIKHIEDKSQENASYVCEELNENLPHPLMPESVKKVEEDGVEIVVQKTLEERLDCAIQQAEKEGEIIILNETQEDSVVIIEDPDIIDKMKNRKTKGNEEVRVKIEKRKTAQDEEVKVKIEKGMGNHAKRARLEL